MNRETARRAAGALALAVALCARPGSADDGLLLVPGNQTATPDGALSLLGNPAGLSGIAGYDVRLHAVGATGQRVDQVDGAYQTGLAWGLAGALPIGPLALGAAVEAATLGAPDRNASRDVLQGRLGASWSVTERIQVGAAWLGRTDDGGPSRGGWRLGLLWRPVRWASLGLRAGIDPRNTWNSQTNTSVAAGLGIRPLGTDRWTLAADLAPQWQQGLDTPQLGWGVSTTLGVARGIDVIVQQTALPYVARVAAVAAEGTDWRTSLAIRVSFGEFGADVGGYVESRGRQGWTPDAVAGLRMSGDTLASPMDNSDPAVLVDLQGELSEHTGSGGTHFGRLLLRLSAIGRQSGTEVVVLRARAVKLDWAQVEELREQIARLRKQGRKVIWFADELGTRALAVASACDRIWLQPAGVMSAHGVAADFLSLSEALAKLGVAVQVVRYAEFKSAGESLVNREPSAELKQTLEHAVDRRWHDFVQWVSLGRDVTPGQLEASLAVGVSYPPDAKAAKLIDDVVADGELDAKLIALGWLEPGEHVAAARRPAVRRATWGPAPSIAVVQIEGNIVDHHSGQGLTGPAVGGTDIAECIGRLAQDGDTSAIVARIASGGGSAAGSESMREALVRAAQRKPVVASMGGVAASGGFWLALGAPLTLADRGTVTGSIGILMIKPDTSALYAKLGVAPTSYGRGPFPGLERLDRPWTAQEVALVHQQLGRFYNLFVDLTARRRKLSHDAVLALAGGRLWFGDEAVQKGLVDRTGGLLDAIAEARKAADPDGDSELAVRFVPEQTWLQQARALIGVEAAADQPAADQALSVLRLAAGPWLDAAVLANLASARPWAHIDVPLESRDR